MLKREMNIADYDAELWHAGAGLSADQQIC